MVPDRERERNAITFHFFNSLVFVDTPSGKRISKKEKNKKSRREANFELSTNSSIIICSDKFGNEKKFDIKFFLQLEVSRHMNTHTHNSKKCDVHYRSFDGTEAPK